MSERCPHCFVPLDVSLTPDVTGGDGAYILQIDRATDTDTGLLAEVREVLAPIVTRLDDFEAWRAEVGVYPGHDGEKLAYDSPTLGELRAARALLRRLEVEAGNARPPGEKATGGAQARPQPYSEGEGR